MSVPAYKRYLSKVEYISQAQELLRMSVQNCKKIPKQYTFFGKTHCYELAQDILDNCARANITNLQTNYQLRTEYLNKALSSLACLSMLLQTLILYGGLEDYKWVNWGNQIDLCEKLIKGVLKSDKEKMGA